MWLKLSCRTNLLPHSKTRPSRVVRFALHSAAAQLNRVVRHHRKSRMVRTRRRYGSRLPNPIAAAPCGIGGSNNLDFAGRAHPSSTGQNLFGGTDSKMNLHAHAHGYSNLPAHSLATSPASHLRFADITGLCSVTATQLGFAIR